jgi:hypothetical protein
MKRGDPVTRRPAPLQAPLHVPPLPPRRGRIRRPSAKIGCPPPEARAVRSEAPLGPVCNTVSKSRRPLRTLGPSGVNRRSLWRATEPPLRRPSPAEQTIVPRAGASTATHLASSRSAQRASRGLRTPSPRAIPPRARRRRPCAPGRPFAPRRSNPRRRGSAPTSPRGERRRRGARHGLPTPFGIQSTLLPGGAARRGCKAPARRPLVPARRRAAAGADGRHRGGCGERPARRAARAAPRRRPRQRKARVAPVAL